MTNTGERKILLLGSGYVAKPCADFLLRRPENKLTVASRKLENAQKLAKQLGGESIVKAISFDVDNESELANLIAQYDLVISLIPYIHHAQVIKAAIKGKKHVVTTSYVNPQMAELHQDAIKAGITVMNEIGLDPGIDHLYAVKTIDQVHREGGKLKSFVSYCGGLPAPECSNNPLGYKFSWSSRGVLLALRNTAKYLKDGRVVEIPGPELMNSAQPIFTGYPAFSLVGYPNRDSTPYNERYNIPECETVLRGTLRFSGFPEFVSVLVSMGFLKDDQVSWLSADAQLSWRQLTCKMLQVDSSATDDQLLKAIFDKGQVSKMSKFNQDNIANGVKWLGLLSDNAKVQPRGNYLDTLCALLEKKMAYGEGERDLVFLQHRFDIENKDGSKKTIYSTMIEYGVPGGYTAMAKTVGIPCGIAVQQILDGKLTEKGVIAPMTMKICEPLIAELEKEGIKMVDHVIE
ncbi:hypothetical protein MIR68_010176 [Amoeboaphelidium protococcarum]|nr:hypothetical protein MIR68_010176 [Amoeboaphelidium protococcarum]